MRLFYHFSISTAIALPFFIHTLLSPPFTAGLASAQERGGNTIQTTLTEGDRALLVMLIQRAYRRSGSIRELQAEQATSLLESVEIEAQVTPNNETEIIFNPINLLNSLIQQPALSAQIRAERAAIRAEVLEIYVNYIRSRQASHLARLSFEQTLAKLSESDPMNQVASQDVAIAPTFDILPGDHPLVQNGDYVDAANALLAAQTDEILALERLSGLVGMTPAEILAILDRYRTPAITTASPPHLH